MKAAEIVETSVSTILYNIDIIISYKFTVMQRLGHVTVVIIVGEHVVFLLDFTTLVKSHYHQVNYNM